MIRALAIAVELVILFVVIFSLLWAVRLTLFDLWLGPRYRAIVTLALAVLGGLVMVFLIAHLVSFYPP